MCSCLQRLQTKVLKLVDVSYGGENGFNQVSIIYYCPIICLLIIKEIQSMPSALLIYISTLNFLRT